MTHTLAVAGMILKSLLQTILRRTAVVALLLLAAVGCSVPVNVDKPSTQREPPTTSGGIKAPNSVSKDQAIEIACRAMRVKNPDSYLSVLPPSFSDSNQPTWIVQYAHPLGDNWHVKVDARTGEVLEKGKQPSR